MKISIIVGNKDGVLEYQKIKFSRYYGVAKELFRKVKSRDTLNGVLGAKTRSHRLSGIRNRK